MTITIKFNTASFQDLSKYLAEIADLRAVLVKKSPDIVVNVEVRID